MLAGHDGLRWACRAGVVLFFGAVTACGLIANDAVGSSVDGGDEAPDRADSFSDAEPVEDSVDATRDADAADAPPEKDALDANERACPPTFRAATGTCTEKGLTCAYPEGVTTCGSACPPGCGIPQTCASLGLNCGAVASCGGIIECGRCSPNETCGGGGVMNVCGGAPPDAACVPQACGSRCGIVPDGCGDVLDCGICPEWLAPGPGCPASPPAEGSSCTNGMVCNYLTKCCSDRPNYTCQAGKWQAMGACPS